MTFQVEFLKDNLVYIRWLSSPTEDDDCKFIASLKSMLAKADEPIYIICDSRLGHIVNPLALRTIAGIQQHPMWGGIVEFGRDGLTEFNDPVLIARIYSRDNRLPSIIKSALQDLETWSPGITKGINWHDVLEQRIAS